MNSQREAFNKDIKARLSEYIEFAESTHKYSDVSFYNDVLATIKALESDRWQAAMAQGGEPLAWYDPDHKWNLLNGGVISACGQKVPMFSSPLYEHPPKPNGDVVEPFGSDSAYAAAMEQGLGNNMTISCKLVVELIDALRVAGKPTGGGVPDDHMSVPRRLVEKWASVDAFNAPKGAAMEIKTAAQMMLATQQPNPEPLCYINENDIDRLKFGETVVDAYSVEQMYRDGSKSVGLYLPEDKP